MAPRQLARIRRDGYQLLAAALLYPDDDARLASLAAAAARQLRNWDRLVGLALYRPWTAMLRTLAMTEPSDGPTLRRAYAELFWLPGKSAPPLYESQYLGYSPALTAALVAALAGEYASMGLVAKPALGEPADHLPIELEFMAFLCNREASAWAGDSHPETVAVLHRQRRFIRQHLGRWAPAVGRGLLMSTPVPFYRAVGEGLEAFINHERDLIDLLLAHALDGDAAVDKAEAAS